MCILYDLLFISLILKLWNTTQVYEHLPCEYKCQNRISYLIITWACELSSTEGLWIFIIISFCYFYDSVISANLAISGWTWICSFLMAHLPSLSQAIYLLFSTGQPVEVIVVLLGRAGVNIEPWTGVQWGRWLRAVNPQRSLNVERSREGRVHKVVRAKLHTYTQKKRSKGKEKHTLLSYSVFQSLLFVLVLYL